MGYNGLLWVFVGYYKTHRNSSEPIETHKILFWVDRVDWG